MSDLFRREAIEHATQRLEGQVFLASPLSLKTLGLLLSGIVFAAAIFAATATYARKTTVTGFLVPDQGMIRITSQAQGTLRSVLVKEGDTVRRARAWQSSMSRHRPQPAIPARLFSKVFSRNRSRRNPELNPNWPCYSSNAIRRRLDPTKAKANSPRSTSRSSCSRNGSSSRGTRWIVGRPSPPKAICRSARSISAGSPHSPSNRISPAHGARRQRRSASLRTSRRGWFRSRWRSKPLAPTPMSPKPHSNSAAPIGIAASSIFRRANHRTDRRAARQRRPSCCGGWHRRGDHPLRQPDRS